MILIISNKWDITVDFVIRELNVAGYPYLRINTEDLRSGCATVTIPDFHIYVSKQSQLYDLTEDIRVVWNRRAGKPFDDVPKREKPTQATERFVNDQWYSWLESLQLLPEVTWINHPRSNDAMESKIRQLMLAARVGFTIPDTLISNDAEVVRQKIAQYGGKIIAKALYSPLIEEPEEDYFIFTNEIGESDVKDEEQLRIAPVIFQKPFVPKVDYRVTVVGDVVLAAKIVADNPFSVELDWRTQKDGLDFVQCTLPNEVEELCRNYVKESGLVFGAIDLVEHRGNFIFLEINPNGEWGWLQKPYGLPIAQTLCDLMIRVDGGS